MLNIFSGDIQRKLHIQFQLTRTDETHYHCQIVNIEAAKPAVVVDCFCHC